MWYCSLLISVEFVVQNRAIFLCTFSSKCNYFSLLHASIQVVWGLYIKHPYICVMGRDFFFCLFESLYSSEGWGSKYIIYKYTTVTDFIFYYRNRNGDDGNWSHYIGSEMYQNWRVHLKFRCWTTSGKYGERAPETVLRWVKHSREWFGSASSG